MARKNTAKKSAKAGGRRREQTVKGSRGAAPARQRGSKGAGTEVQRCWNDYLSHRTLLEQAVEAVQSAEAGLAQAREMERERRKAFDDRKLALERLLEVEAASTSRGQQRVPTNVPALPDKPVQSPRPQKPTSQATPHRPAPQPARPQPPQREAELG